MSVTRTNGAETAPIGTELDTPEMVPARYATPAAGTGSHGPAIAAWSARVLGVQLHDWQRFAADRLFAVDGDRWAHRTGLLTVGRQNGKSRLLLAALGWAVTDWSKLQGRPITAGLVTHQQRLSNDHAVYLVAALRRAGYVAQFYRSPGAMRANLTNGSVLTVEPNSPNAGHGRTLDFVAIDEAWSVDPAAVDVGLGPTMTATPDPFMLVVSTAGNEGSTLLKRYRERGIAACDTGRAGPLAFVEWSPPPGAPIDDPATWRLANPSVDRSIRPERLAELAETPDAAFIRSTLNTWVATDTPWVEAHQWAACHDAELPPPAGGVVAAEASPDGTRWVAVHAMRAGDRVAVRTAAYAAHEAGLWAQLEPLLSDPTVKLAAGVTLDVHLPPRYRDRTQLVGWREVNRWSGGVRNLVAGRRVAHPGEASLTEHVLRAVPRTGQGGTNLAPGFRDAAIELARCLVWAVALAGRPPTSGRPSLGVGG